MTDNPAAFPHMMVEGHKDYAPGMTLRDWFATHAPMPSKERIAVFVGLDRGRNPNNDPHKPKIRSETQIIADLAYVYADAMLAARGAS